MTFIYKSVHSQTSPLKKKRIALQIQTDMPSRQRVTDLTEFSTTVVLL